MPRVVAHLGPRPRSDRSARAGHCMSVVPITPPADAQVDRFSKWPDGRIHGMFECKPQPKRWHCTNRLLAGRAHALAGVGGSSKTTMQYQVAVGSILGTLPWGWEVAARGSAGLFLTEDTIDDSHRMLHAIGGHLNEEQRKELTKQLRVYQLAGLPARLLALSGSSLLETGVYDWVMAQVDTMPKPVAYVGFDPALGLTEGDEMSPAHQRRLGELMDRIAIDSGACVVLTTHARKNLHQADELDSHASRGSGAITDALRAEYCLRTMTADEARKFGIDDKAQRQRYVQLAATKGNSLPPEAYAPIWLERGQAGLLSEVTLDQVERGSVGQRELQALEILRAANTTGETSMKFWREQCVAKGVIAQGTTTGQEKALERIRDALADAGLVSKGKVRGLWIPV